MESNYDNVLDANLFVFDNILLKDFIEDSPHLKHIELREFYKGLIEKIFNYAAKHTNRIRVLDIGCGNGLITNVFLKLGAEVVAIDLSPNNIEQISVNCKEYNDKLTLICADVFKALNQLILENRKFDIVITNSLLHHIVDYKKLILNAIGLIGNNGQFFCFQDPMRYDLMPKKDYVFSKIAYYSWRIRKKDLIGGVRRLIKRSFGIYTEVEDNTEYHVTRSGVDQVAIHQIFLKHGFESEIIEYFSTQSTLFQKLGQKCGFKNTFAIIARK